MAYRDYHRLPSSGFSSTLNPIAEVNALRSQLHNMDKSTMPTTSADRKRRRTYQDALDKWEGSREYAEALDAAGHRPSNPSAPFWHQPGPARRESVEDHRSGSQRYRDFLASLPSPSGPPQHDPHQPIPSLSLHPASPLTSSPPPLHALPLSLYTPQRRASSFGSTTSSSGSGTNSSSSLSEEFRGRSRGDSDASEDQRSEGGFSERTAMPPVVKPRSIRERVFRRLTPSRSRSGGGEARQGRFM
ncbi:hypothetical protein BCR35DRAFT_355526 [Leucosporidium creatinivorum]|uniref:Uncharacterized protein n=1 Tax=Leucosporidium creatinivorum TaxID=106004 RepID=A0A1Y2DCW1_9BASI|nr:hypothetical protein BCR35DRAFT_355526 [Leucosporidium creatinivorum]